MGEGRTAVGVPSIVRIVVIVRLDRLESVVDGGGLLLSFVF